MATSTVTTKPNYLYKILPSTEDLPQPPPSHTYILPKTSLDVHSGFIHFSTNAQVPYVLNRFFNSPETSTVWLVKINYAELSSNGDVRWEKAGESGSLFAHLYGGEVTGDAVHDVLKLHRGDGWDSALQTLADQNWLA
ncbi:MAG: hypothetical protein L6R35_004980 [Caloplaca aegaea]|nr:MAG: hypothetical protein L6R35_004980 [Caloplaca aegaea]